MQNGHARHHDVERGGKIANGHSPSDEGKTPWRFSTVVEEFQQAWFTVSMNTGIISILMKQNPYQFHGLDIISTIMFIFNIVLFVLVFSMFMLRLILHPKGLIKQCTTDLTSLTMLGCIPIAFFTIIGDIGITTSTASWGGYSWFLVAYAFWWTNTVVMICIAFLVMVVVSTTNVTNTEIFNPSMVLPFVGTATDAVVGALIVNYSDGVTARLAVPVILMSYILVGIGFWVAMLVFAIYFVRLMNNGLPPGAQSPSLCLLVGPCGQTAAAIQLLGAAAMKYFGSYNRGTFLQTNAGMVCAAAGELLGFFIIGLALFFSIFVIYVLIHVAVKREHQFSMIWWSTIFPFATVNTAWIAFATALDSPTFKVLSSIFLITLVIDYLVLWGFVLRDIVQGRLLSGKKAHKQEDEKEQ